jgi:hypothetical protein
MIHGSESSTTHAVCTTRICPPPMWNLRSSFSMELTTDSYLSACERIHPLPKLAEPLHSRTHVPFRVVETSNLAYPVEVLAQIAGDRCGTPPACVCVH